MRDFETGIVYINAGTTGAETHLPFGGWKDTGNGHREAGHVALDTFTEWKAIYVDFAASSSAPRSTTSPPDGRCRAADPADAARGHRVGRRRSTSRRRATTRRSTRPSTGSPSAMPSSPGSRAELEAAEEEDLHIVAVVDGAVVGQLDAIGGRRRSPGSMRVQRASASIGIAVLDGWRGRGIGTALMAAAEDWARGRGLDVLELDVATPNEGGRRLYERLGYIRVAESMVKPLREG